MARDSSPLDPPARDESDTGLELRDEIRALRARLADAKRAEQAFAELTARLNAVLDGAVDGILTIDESGTVESVNPAACTLFGYDADEIIGNNVKMLMPAEYRDEHDGYLANYRRTGQKKIIGIGREVVGRRKNGTQFPMELSVGEANAGDRKVFSGIIRDRSHRIRQDELLDQTHESFVVTDLETRIVYWNQAAERMFEVSRSDALEMTMAEVLGRTSVGSGVAWEVVEAVQRDGRYELENPYISPSGVEAYHRSSSTLLRDVLGNPTGVLAIIEDITSERTARLQLAESEQRLRALFQQRSSLSGICDLDGKLLDVNKAALDFVGAARSEVIGRPFWTTPWWSHDPELQGRLREGLSRCAATGEFVRFDAQHPRVDGVMGTVDFSVSRIDGVPGQQEILLVESVEVTDQRSLQEQLIQAQKLEAIGTLAGGVAHDFNNLLTSIQGSAEMIARKADSDGLAGRSASRIIKAAERGEALTKQLLAFSRKQVTRPETLDLNESLREAGELFVRMIGEDIELDWSLADVPGAFRFDRAQFDQVIVNLVVNARDAMPNGGQLSISTGIETVDAQIADSLGIAPGAYLRASVTDSGSGIPPEVRPQIFDPFFTTKEQGRGTGLGLSTVLGIVRDHGGAIAVDSEIGRGTTFNVYLPCVADIARTRASATSEPVAPEEVGRRTLLIVEDDLLLRELMTEVLEEAGYRVLAAADPTAALERVRADGGGIDLVITDVVMPGMSGFSLAKGLMDTNASLRVLFMSGYADQVLTDRGELSEGDAFIRKPFRNAEICEKVAEVLAGPPSAR